MNTAGYRWLLPASLVAITSATMAQSTPSKRLDPLDAGASVPAAAYASALANYQPYSEQGVVSWKQANEAVNRIGGWRVYAREARQPEAAQTPANPTAPAPAGAPAGHGGHKAN